jgi:ribulose-bisphosphate carboxylase small chain
MRTETFSYLPPLTEVEIAAQVRSIVDRGLVCGIEHVAEPDPRRHYWALWGLPLFGETDPDEIMRELAACRRAFPDHYVRVNGYDRFRQGQVASFVAAVPETATA